jgi:putative glutamine amidotransferase
MTIEKIFLLQVLKKKIPSDIFRLLSMLKILNLYIKFSSHTVQMIFISKSRYLSVFFVVSFIFFGCHSVKQPLILISKDDKRLIEIWLQKTDPNIKVKECYNLQQDSLKRSLRKAKGIILGGGVDINPELYHKPEYRDLCRKPDLYRDSLEMELIKYAFRYKIPLLGICRGNQMINVALGGTLIPDLPSVKPEWELHRNGSETAHYLIIAKGSWLDTLIGNDFVWVNSRHHQAIDLIAPGFRVSAWSADSVIESIEIISTSEKPFVVGIQWHPEMLNDSLSAKTARMFIDKVKSIR